MSAPENIKDLVRRFEEHREAYRSGRYNETQLRREFLDPFFEALGWDIFNKQSLAEPYKDVIHEDSLIIEGENKAPDYAFRMGGTRKFFVEAKSRRSGSRRIFIQRSNQDYFGCLTCDAATSVLSCRRRLRKRMFMVANSIFITASKESKSTPSSKGSCGINQGWVNPLARWKLIAMKIPPIAAAAVRKNTTSRTRSGTRSKAKSMMSGPAMKTIPIRISPISMR